jgi:uncharacterized protein
MIIEFLINCREYITEVIPALLIGFLLSGLIHEFVPQSIIDRHLVKRGILSLLYIVIAGIFLPLCCAGSLPVAISLRKRGVPLGSVLAFLITTPATSITAILIAWQLMGSGFTIYLCFSVIVMGLIIGIIGNLFFFKNMQNSADKHISSGECVTDKHSHDSAAINKRFLSVINFAFIDLPKKIGLELLGGLLIAAFIVSFTPIRYFIQNYLYAGFSYLFAVSFGLIMYICSTASVPLVDAFAQQGLDIGAALVLLLVGPITSFGVILVIRKEFGNKVLLFYLSIIIFISVLSGLLYTKLLI